MHPRVTYGGMRPGQVRSHGRIKHWGWANSEAYYKYPDAEEFWVEINQSVQGCMVVRPLSGQ